MTRARVNGTIGTVYYPAHPTDLDLTPTEMLRRLNNVVRVGTVAEVQHTTPARCRVKTGDLLTDWLPWSAVRAGTAKVWWPPTVGEQVVVLSPGGDLANAMVMHALYSDAAAQNSESPTEMHITWANGDTLVHDSATGTLSLTCKTSIAFHVGQTTLQVNETGVFVSPDVTAGGRVSLLHHVHGQVKSGPDKTGEPA